MMSQEIRRKFLQYFKDQGHAVIGSAPVVPHDDPTLLFNNAGMNQFKDVFLGTSVRDYNSAVTSQKCIRVGGKHNDLENVGHTKRHLTFFEMLGNFSFGAYFKKEAIQFAWEVSTGVFGLDGDRIWPTVFETDDEAYELWKQYVPEKRICRFGEKDNFWSMGETGPCGPCSELLFDRGENYGSGKNPHEDVDGERYLEFWNLVFMQSNRDEGGVVTPLPTPCIDTGAGLERVVSLKLDVDNVFETDILGGLIESVGQIASEKYGERTAAAYHVIADHLRCLAFAIADGVQPSNVDRGYVLRKVLRRAVRYGRYLGFDQPFLGRVLPRLIEIMGSDYPELVHSEVRIGEILYQEEEAFFRTLRRGGAILTQVIERAETHEKQISGEDAFKLKDTYGLPFEEVVLLAKDADLRVDEKRYQELEEEAKERSRKAHKGAKQIAATNLFEDHAKSTFLGYTQLTSEAEVKSLVVNGSFVQEMVEGEEGIVVLNQTPFYAEKGGQVGDTGTLSGADQRFDVKDTQEPFKGVIAHVGKLEKGRLKVGDRIEGKVEAMRRQLIANNHTATHLLHWALQEVLGPHIKQAGSVVSPDRLRFDFSHHKAMSIEELNQIEDLVNDKIRENHTVKGYEISYEEAQQQEEIKQFFGDKYGARVRVIDIDVSKELCGGTHTSVLGLIGYFRIVKEGSIAAGVRRIEAVTGAAAEQFARESDQTLLTLAEKLKVPVGKVSERIEKLLEEQQAIQKEAKERAKQEIEQLVTTLTAGKEMIKEIPFLGAKVDVSSESFRPLVDRCQEQLQSGVLIMGRGDADKCQLIIRVTSDWVEKGIKASDLIKELAPLIGGSGGGKADAAQAGGKAIDQMPQLLQRAKELISHVPA
ncbi:MAG: alanine--tRNA ligase [Chlamydiia bacterium]|nr:alanine--tRNA ligase [Chlamydiia bacterium]